MTQSELQIKSSFQQVEKLYGKYPARVLNNNPSGGEEHRGELLVEIAGLLEEDPGGSGERLMQVRALPCFMPGFFIIPENKAHVWVEFAAGDINTPIWTGVWYPTEKTPKTFDDQTTTKFQKIIRTDSGHVIQIDDTKDKEKIIIRHKADTIVSMDNDLLDMTHHSGSHVTIDKDGNMTLQHKDGTCMEFKESKVIITADNIDLKGNVNISKNLVVGEGPSTTISGNEITGG